MRKKLQGGPQNMPGGGGVPFGKSMKKHKTHSKFDCFLGLAAIMPTCARVGLFPPHNKTTRGTAITNSYKLQPLVTIPDALWRKSSVSMVI